MSWSLWRPLLLCWQGFNRLAAFACLDPKNLPAGAIYRSPEPVKHIPAREEEKKF